RLARALLGQSLGANMFMLGYAYQIGALPLSAAAIERALELNGEAVPMNIAAFSWGRRAALPARAAEESPPPRGVPVRVVALSRSSDETVARRVAFLTEYQNAAY